MLDSEEAQAASGVERTAGEVERVNDKARRDALIAQADHIRGRAVTWSEIYRHDATLWRRIATTLALAAALLAAIAGGISAVPGIGDVTSRTIAAITGLGAAAITAVVAALGGAKRSSEALAAAVRDTGLADQAEVFIQTVALFVPLDDAVHAFERLAEQRSRVVDASPGTQLPRLLGGHAPPS